MKGLVTIPYNEIRLPSGSAEIGLRVKKLVSLFRDESFVLGLYEMAEKEGKLEVPSLHSKGMAVCKKSYYAKRNFLFFEDSGGCFYLIQHHAFMYGLYLPEEGVFFSQEDNNALHSRLVAELEKVKGSEYENGEDGGFLGLLNGYSRPYHYFYDRFPFFFKLLPSLKSPKVMSIKGGAFLKVSDFFAGVDEVLVSDLHVASEGKSGFFLDISFPFGYTRKKKIGGTGLSIKREVLKKRSNKFLEKQEEIDKCYPLIWIGLCSEKRVWPERSSVIAKIIGGIIDRYPDAGFLFDGMTRDSITESVEFKEKYCQKDLASLDEVLGLVGVDVNYVSLIGASAEDKIYWGSRCDFFFTSALTDSIWVSHFNRKPGVAYAASIAKEEHHSHHKTYLLPKSYVEDLDDGEDNWAKKGYRLSEDACYYHVVEGADFELSKKCGFLLHPMKGKGFKVLKDEFDDEVLTVDVSLEGSKKYLTLFDKSMPFDGVGGAFSIASGSYRVVLDAVCEGSASCQLVIITYSDEGRENTYFINVSKGKEIAVSLGECSFTPYLRVSGTGSVKYFGYSMQPLMRV